MISLSFQVVVCTAIFVHVGAMHLSAEADAIDPAAKSSDVSPLLSVSSTDDALPGPQTSGAKDLLEMFETLRPDAGLGLAQRGYLSDDHGLYMDIAKKCHKLQGHAADALEALREGAGAGSGRWNSPVRRRQFDLRKTWSDSQRRNSN